MDSVRINVQRHEDLTLWHRVATLPDYTPEEKAAINARSKEMWSTIGNGMRPMLEGGRRRSHMLSR